MKMQKPFLRKDPDPLSGASQTTTLWTRWAFHRCHRTSIEEFFGIEKP